MYERLHEQAAWIELHPGVPVPERASWRAVVRAFVDAGDGLQLPPEAAAIVWAAIASASGALSSPVEGPEASAEACAAPQPPEEQRTDALVNVARAYLEHQPRTLGSSHELVGGFLRDGTPTRGPRRRELLSGGSPRPTHPKRPRTGPPA